MKNNLISKHFSKSAKHYDAHAVLPQKLCSLLTEYISARIKNKYKNGLILDIGTGTGELIITLKKMFPDAVIAGFDIAHGMIEEANKKINQGISGNKTSTSDIYLFQADAEKIPVKDTCCCFAVSNAAYQWISDLEQAFKEVFRILTPGGKFIFTIFGDRTLNELIASGSNKVGHLEFKNKEKIILILTKTGFAINDFITHNYIIYNPDIFSLLQSLKRMGAGNIFWEKGLSGRAFLKKLNTNYTNLFGTDKGLPATFEIFVVSAVKHESNTIYKS
ncbi:methyltransferase domain-containing protein [Candidatus Desantisbacteria bacterium]|nr:methyltransferase domain-containing protein [Candidatus Desantisbacteria bacterium]